jgi:hypothetical protein
MKVTVKPIHASPVESPTVSYEGLLEVTLSKIFNGVKIVTEDGAEFGVCLRDTGLEIKCPGGELVGVKLCSKDHHAMRDTGEVAYVKQGEMFVERNGQVIG